MDVLVNRLWLSKLLLSAIDLDISGLTLIVLDPYTILRISIPISTGDLDDQVLVKMHWSFLTEIRSTCGLKTELC